MRGVVFFFYSLYIVNAAAVQRADCPVLKRGGCDLAVWQADVILALWTTHRQPDHQSCL